MHHLNAHRRNPPEAGFAIGAILFVIALLVILGVVIAAGGGGFTTAGTADRIAPTIAQQANLIRSVINQCNIQYLSSRALCNTVGTCPSCSLVAGTACSVDITNSDPYPQAASGGTVVGSLLCDPAGGLSLWTQTLMPQPTTDFTNWTYVDALDTGGRCIWTEPTISSPNTNSGIVTGLTRAASNFSNATSYDATSEVIYDPNSGSQRFIMWITMPTGAPDSNCLP